MSAEEGSCPYLLSQGAEGSDWIDHGKILHAAPSQDREYTDVRNFSGFRARFRIEEREPEAAFINRAELTVVLKDGRTMSLTAGNGKPALELATGGCSGGNRCNSSFRFLTASTRRM